MKRALLVNCSAPHYNLGVAKLAHWLRGQGWHVETTNGDPGLFSFGFDLVCLSVIFSWHAPIAAAIANRVKSHAEVWCGGPIMHALKNWWKAETGMECVSGLDWRFERERGDYKMTFASRGCPVGCWFCIVPVIEGLEFTLDPDFVPAPVLCDNNLSALPDDFQEHIVRRYAESGVPLKDANSGFEPRYFTEETYRRWKPALRGAWRFAYDECKEEESVRSMLGILAAESSRKKQCYVLIGNEPIADCHERCRQVIAWGGEPYCQAFVPLNALEKRPSVRYDWTETTLRDFCRFHNRHLWRSLELTEYLPRQDEPPPFRGTLARKRVSLSMA